MAGEQTLTAWGPIWVQLMTETKAKSQKLDQTIFGLQCRGVPSIFLPADHA